MGRLTRVCGKSFVDSPHSWSIQDARKWSHTDVCYLNIDVQILSDGYYLLYQFVACDVIPNAIHWCEVLENGHCFWWFDVGNPEAHDLQWLYMYSHISSYYPCICACDLLSFVVLAL